MLNQWTFLITNQKKKLSNLTPELRLGYFKKL